MKLTPMYGYEYRKKQKKKIEFMRIYIGYCIILPRFSNALTHTIFPPHATTAVLADPQPKRWPRGRELAVSSILCARPPSS